MPVSVVLAEDSLVVREGVRALVDAVDELQLAGVCSSYDELLAMVEQRRPDVVITDIRMPPTGTDEGVRAALVIRARWPGTGVVVLSQYAEAEEVLALFEHGTSGIAYLLKERLGDVEQLLEAVARVNRNGSLVDPKVIEVLVGAHAARREARLDRLSAREIEVLGQVAEGKTNAAIARNLHLSERAVEKHINSIFSKLDLALDPDVNKRVAAVVLWLTERNVRMATPRDE